jgi:hypothetical protein
LQAAAQEDGSFKIAIFGSPHKTVPLDSSWKTNNQKKLQAVQATVKSELATKSGRAWDSVKEFATAHNFIIKG